MSPAPKSRFKEREWEKMINCRGCRVDDFEESLDLIEVLLSKCYILLTTPLSHVESSCLYLSRRMRQSSRDTRSFEPRYLKSQ